VYHSDRGLQYACSDYTGILNAHGIWTSVRRVANPYDNARASIMSRYFCRGIPDFTHF
jgi:transposase InsO family protein